MFTHNQVRQFYVATSYVSDASGMATANAGAIHVESDGANDMYFNFVNADGEVMRTDLINTNKIISVTVTPSAEMKYTSKATYVALSDDVIDSQTNNPVAGEDYILSIKSINLKYQSETSPIWKQGMVHTTTTTTPDKFYKTLAKSLAANLKKGIFVDMNVYLTSATAASGFAGGTNTLVNNMSDADIDAIGSANCKAIVIDEKTPCIYDVFGDYVTVSGDDTMWANVEETTGLTTFENGQKIVDMEKFYHGERGDIYREAAYPTNWDNKMLASASEKYDTIDIHYYWNGANHAVQKSEKDITIACPSGVTSSLLTAIKAAASGNCPDISTVSYSSGAVSFVVVE